MARKRVWTYGRPPRATRPLHVRRREAIEQIERSGSGGGESKSLTNQKFDVRSSPNLRSGTVKPPPAKEQQVAEMSETRKKKLSASRDNRRAVTINTMKNAPPRRSPQLVREGRRPTQC